MWRTGSDALLLFEALGSYQGKGKKKARLQTPLLQRPRVSIRSKSKSSDSKETEQEGRVSAGAVFTGCAFMV